MGRAFRRIEEVIGSAEADLSPPVDLHDDTTILTEESLSLGSNFLIYRTFDKCNSLIYDTAFFIDAL